MTEEFQAQKKVQRAELVVPPNQLKEKAGSGGFDETTLVKAQEQIKSNTVDFRPIAVTLLDQLEKAITDARSGAVKGEAAVRAILAPAMQLKAQGSMFHYPVVSEISNILVNFMETVTDIDKDVLDIVAAHKTSMSVVISSRIQEDEGKVGKKLCGALVDTCDRYYKTRKNK